MTNEDGHVDQIPIIQLWGNLLVPLQGDISDTQAEYLSGRLLQRIRNSDVSGLVIDVSGVSVIDSHLCGLLARLVSAAELMGVAAVLCGLNPEIVMTLQAMDIDLAEIETALSLEAALERLGQDRPGYREALEREPSYDHPPGAPSSAVPAPARSER